MKKDNKSINILYFLFYMLFVNHINYFFHMINKFAGIPNVFTTYITMGIYLAVFAYIIVNKNNRLGVAILFVGFVYIVYNISRLSLGGYAVYMTSAIYENLFLYCMPTYVAAYIVDDYSDIDNVLSKYSYLLLIIYTMAIICQVRFPDYFVENDYQGISYGLMIPFVFFTLRIKKKKTDFFLSAFILLLLLFFGGRGPLVCALLCILYRSFENSKENFGKIFFMMILIALIVIFYKNILNIIIGISTKYGMSGSVAKYYNKGDIFSDSGRNTIREIALEIIKDKWLLGCNLGGDRYYLGLYGFKFGNYPHNMLLEFWIQYGVVIGSILFIVLLKSIMDSFKLRENNKELYLLICVCFFSTGFMILLFSSSYLISPLFFAMLGFMSNMKRSISNEKDRNSDISSES